MSLGLAIFASVVLILLVYNKPFRTVFTRVAGTLAALAVVGALGWYVYGRYQTYAQAKQAVAHKTLIDACVARYSSSGYANSDEWAKYLNVEATCENDPNVDWTDKAKKKSEWVDYVPPMVEIHGGETLKMVQNPNSSETINGVHLDLRKDIPLLYLGHHQKFVLACGNFGEQGTLPKTDPKTGGVTCP